VSSPLPQSVQIDAHTLWREDDLICLRAVGDLTAGVVDWVQTASQQILAQHPEYYVLADLLDAGPIQPALRRRLVEHVARHPARAIAFYRVNFVAYGINALLFGALNTLGKRKQLFKQFASESEARLWLSSQRPVAGSGGRGG
jgi:hypothetical protein